MILKDVTVLYAYVLCSVAQLCSIPCDPIACSPSGSSAHGIFQARILERGTISCSRGSSQPRERTHISCLPYWQVDSSHWAPPRKPTRVYKLNQRNKHDSLPLCYQLILENYLTSSSLDVDFRAMKIFTFAPHGLLGPWATVSRKPRAWRSAHKCWVSFLPYGSARVFLCFGAELWATGSEVLRKQFRCNLLLLALSWLYLSPGSPSKNVRWP